MFLTYTYAVQILNQEHCNSLLFSKNNRFPFLDDFHDPGIPAEAIVEMVEAGLQIAKAVLPQLNSRSNLKRRGLDCSDGNKVLQVLFETRL